MSQLSNGWPYCNLISTIVNLHQNAKIVVIEANICRRQKKNNIFFVLLTKSKFFFLLLTSRSFLTPHPIIRAPFTRLKLTSWSQFVSWAVPFLQIARAPNKTMSIITKWLTSTHWNDVMAGVVQCFLCTISYLFPEANSFFGLLFGLTAIAGSFRQYVIVLGYAS